MGCGRGRGFGLPAAEEEGGERERDGCVDSLERQIITYYSVRLKVGNVKERKKERKKDRS